MAETDLVCGELGNWADDLGRTDELVGSQALSGASSLHWHCSSSVPPLLWRWERTSWWTHWGPCCCYLYWRQCGSHLVRIRSLHSHRQDTLTLLHTVLTKRLVAPPPQVGLVAPPPWLRCPLRSLLRPLCPLAHTLHRLHFLAKEKLTKQDRKDLHCKHSVTNPFPSAKNWCKELLR